MSFVLFGVMRDLTQEDLERLGEILGVSIPRSEPEPPPAEPPEPPAEEPPQPPPVSVGPNFDAAPGFVQFVIREHWPKATWEHAAAIARCESGWRPDAHNTSGEDSRGLWQINVVPAANPDLLELGDLFDPATNARAAAIVWERQGWRAWLNCATALGIPRTGPGVP